MQRYKKNVNRHHVERGIFRLFPWILAGWRTGGTDRTDKTDRTDRTGMQHTLGSGARALRFL